VSDTDWDEVGDRGEVVWGDRLSSWPLWMDFVSSVRPRPIEWLNVGRLDDRLMEEAVERGIEIYSVVPEGALKPAQKDRMGLASAERLPFADGRFDVVSAFEAVDSLAGLEELVRVLKEGGILLFGAPDPVYLSQRESPPVGHPPAFWVHHLQRLGCALKLRFFPGPSDLEILAIKGEANEEVLGLLKRECIASEPDIVTLCGGPVLWALREGWSVLLRDDRPKGYRSFDKKAVLYLLNTSRTPLQLTAQIEVRAGRPPQSLWISVDGWPLKTIRLADGGRPLRVDLPSFKIGAGGHELALESEGRIFVDGIDVACEPVDHREFCLELPFDQYQRYKIIQEIVDELRGGEGMRVLDVGGHPGLLLSFLPHDEVYITDVVPCDIPTFMPTGGKVLPFEDESFDVVVSSDTLEHVPPEEREGFISELVRVSRDCVVLAAPFADADVLVAEQILYEFVKNELGYSHKCLKEHLEYGLPRWRDMEGLLKAKGLRYSAIPNGYLYHWLFMMLASFYIRSLPNSRVVEAKVNAFYNAHFYESDNAPPGYRKVIIISKGAKEVEAMSYKYRGRAGNPVSAAVKAELINLLAVAIGLEQQARIEELKRALEMKEGDKAALQEVVKRFKRVVKGL